MRGLNEYFVIAALLLVVCLAHFGVAYAGATDPTPSQIVSAIKRAHIEGIAASNPRDASRFVVYQGGDAYGPEPRFDGEHFILDSVKYLTVNGRHLVLFHYLIGNAAWKDFAFFVGSLNYAGALPNIGPHNGYQPVGQNLMVTLKTMQHGDAYCCPSGPWRTVAVFSANSHGLFTVTSNPAATPSTRIVSVGAVSSAHPTGASAVVRQFYTMYIHNKADLASQRSMLGADLAPERGLLDDRLYWLLTQENAIHPGSKGRPFECNGDADDFGLGQGPHQERATFTLGTPIAQGNAVIVPVFGQRVTAIIKDEGGTYKIYDINAYGGLLRQALEGYARDPNCAWPKSGRG